ncbi:MAG: helix-turn-helix domain-containing protein [Methylococcales bacterium]|jgi:phage repressor protein C with HTH and peptisase S24 domain|nr:helix-turn-helix domain-containing protein [Methylococcales bacterium]MBT7444949.1 helix-turn-helix domain-containing protein [Methylococcales bacterium]
MDTIAKRIKSIRKQFDLTQAQMGSMVKVSKAAVSQWERGLANPDVNVVLALEKALNINPRWLINGEDDRQELDKGDVEVPFFKEVSFAAGHGSHLEDHNQTTDSLTFKKNWLDEKGYQKEQLLVVYARGDSMQPRICDGDVLLVKSGETNIIDGAVYALNYAGNAKVKRLSLKYDGALMMSSDNTHPQYKDELIPASDTEQLNIIGRVVWVGGDL